MGDLAGFGQKGWRAKGAKAVAKLPEGLVNGVPEPAPCSRMEPTQGDVPRLKKLQKWWVYFSITSGERQSASQLLPTMLRTRYHIIVGNALDKQHIVQSPLDKRVGANQLPCRICKRVDVIEMAIQMGLGIQTQISQSSN